MSDQIKYMTFKVGDEDDSSPKPDRKFKRRATGFPGQMGPSQRIKDIVIRLDPKRSIENRKKHNCTESEMKIDTGKLMVKRDKYHGPPEDGKRRRNTFTINGIHVSSEEGKRRKNTSSVNDADVQKIKENIVTPVSHNVEDHLKNWPTGWEILQTLMPLCSAQLSTSYIPPYQDAQPSLESLVFSNQELATESQVSLFRSFI